ncbi:MAG: Tfp pilus assembly protein FimT/FimU [Gammaproteobacteria bacterium]
MKNIKALTIIETMLVLVVIALILMVAANQFQRYQQTRNIQMAADDVQQLAAYATNLYLKNCTSLKQSPTNSNETPFIVCPAPANGKFPSSYSKACDKNFTLNNTLGGAVGGDAGLQHNYAIYIGYIPNERKNSYSNTLVIQFAMWGVTDVIGSNPAQIVISETFQKVVAAIKPNAVVFDQAKFPNVYFPGSGMQKKYSSQYYLPCTGDFSAWNTACFLWRINSPGNWGVLPSNAASNQTLDTQLAAFATQYVPTTTEWQTIQKANSSAVINCPGIAAQNIQSEQKSSP